MEVDTEFELGGDDMFNITNDHSSKPTTKKKDHNKNMTSDEMPVKEFSTNMTSYETPVKNNNYLSITLHPKMTINSLDSRTLGYS